MSHVCLNCFLDIRLKQLICDLLIPASYPYSYFSLWLCSSL